MDDDILTADNAAGLLKVSTDMVIELLMSGELPGRNVGSGWLTTRRALIGFIDGLSEQSAGCGPGMCCAPRAEMSAAGNRTAPTTTDS